MKCIADMYTKDCLRNEKCCDNCDIDYDDCSEGCLEHDLRDSGCEGCPYAVED